jgi:hypothetical protein
MFESSAFLITMAQHGRKILAVQGIDGSASRNDGKILTVQGIGVSASQHDAGRQDTDGSSPSTFQLASMAAKHDGLTHSWHVSDTFPIADPRILCVPLHGEPGAAVNR